MKRLCGFAIALSLFVVQGRGQNPNLGTSGAQFLKIPAGARASAMAGACVAATDDASAVFWNPAGIARVQSSALSVSHTAWWATSGLNHAVFVQPLKDLGSFGVSVTVLSMDKMEITTELQPEGTGQFFDAEDVMIGVSYARNLTEDFSVGLTAKYVRQRIWNESAGGLAFDVGTQYRVGFRDLTIGMSMTNFGGDLTYDGLDLKVRYDAESRIPNNRLTPARMAPEDYPLPLHFQVGVSMSAYSSDDLGVLFEADVTHPNDNRERVNVGTEIAVMRQFFLRGGYRFAYDIEKATFGAGVAVPVAGMNLTFDYAYAMYDLLPNVNRFSLGMTF